QRADPAQCRSVLAGRGARLTADPRRLLRPAAGAVRRAPARHRPPRGAHRRGFSGLAEGGARMTSVQEVALGSARDLKIEKIETIAVRAPLATEFRGSYYRMTHRATLITRIHTADGLVGEAYVGDEDAGLREIRRIV